VQLFPKSAFLITARGTPKGEVVFRGRVPHSLPPRKMDLPRRYPRSALIIHPLWYRCAGHVPPPCCKVGLLLHGHGRPLGNCRFIHHPPPDKPPPSPPSPAHPTPAPHFPTLPHTSPHLPTPVPPIIAPTRPLLPLPTPRKPLRDPANPAPSPRRRAGTSPNHAL